MSASYDLQPTNPLSGLHMVGMVLRRFLISYPVSPEVLRPFLPAGAECSLHDGAAWVSACVVRMEDVRPNILPRLLGMGFHYLIHRTRARLPFPDGRMREAVLVLQPNIDSQLFSTFGSLLTGVAFQTREIEFQDNADGWRIRMQRRAEVLFDATIPKSGCGSMMPTGSRFSSVERADEFLLGVSFGGQWQQGESVLKLLPETHEPWVTSAGSCVTHCNRFLEHLDMESNVADHALTMEGVPHYFGLRPIRSRLTMAGQ